MKTKKSKINDVLITDKIPREMHKNNPMNVDWELLWAINRYSNKVGLIKTTKQRINRFFDQ